ncbi:MAG: pseudouridine synthase [Bacteroidetes bacterium]|jgi:23S rRNA pseudouridine1911/1915/1917 synthase|nr:pseudouridine synthase [Bacteroidota bacterium]
MKDEAADIEELQEDDAQDLYEHHRITVDKGQVMIRIDKFLVNCIKNATRNKTQNAIDAGNVLVNGKPVKSNYKVKPFDEIVISHAHKPHDTELVPENIPINIVYEDDHVVVVNKEAGMVVHPAFGHYRGTLVNALAYHFQNLPDRKQVIDGQEISRPGLLHRIDKNTSGILIIAKTELAMQKLSLDFFHHNLDRRYIALVWGDFQEDSGTITAHVGRNLKNRKVMDVFPAGDQGKHAITHYKVLERFGYVTLVECKLETGRTHQIRVHMKHIGHPLFNDNEYGGDRILKGTTFSKYKQYIDNCFAMCPRQALHAKSLEITHPGTGKLLKFESDLAPDMKALVEKWRNYAKGLELE